MKLRKHLHDAYVEAIRKSIPSNVLHLDVDAAAGLLVERAGGDIEKAIANCPNDGVVFWAKTRAVLQSVRETANVIPFPKAR